MLDKSIPYFNVIMKHNADIPISDVRLPDGYSFLDFTSGKEVHWAEIEVSVGEFQTPSLALQYFRQEYLPQVDELRRRLVFVQDPHGEDVGTITSWWNYTGKRRDPSVHWLAVKPEHQGRGIGTALIYECLRRLHMLEGNKDVYLHTQTWSHRSIGIYLRAGFEVIPDLFGNYQNDFNQAMQLLSEIMPSTILRKSIREPRT